MIDLSVVIVSWNVCDLLRDCLQSLPEGLHNLSSEVFVVDNASVDGSAAMVHEQFPAVILMQNAENAGFTRANNQALAKSTGRYVLLLNPDTEVAPGSLAAMVAFMDATPQAGVVGPQLTYSDGAVQSSRRRFPTLRTLYLESTILQRLFPRSATLRRFYMLDRPHDAVQEVDWLVGACMMVRREAMAAAGLLDERFFMYCEETDWCLRIKQKGWHVVYLPTARVVHYEARSSEQALPTQHIHFFSSRVAYARKHFGRMQAQGLRLYLLGTYVVQMIEEGAKWLIGHKRPLRARRLALYRQVISSGLDVSRQQQIAASRP